MTRECECQGPGFCRRHQRPKSFVEWMECRKNPEVRRQLDEETAVAAEEAIVLDGGPGTELHKMFGSLGFHPKPDCPCLKHAKEMDDRGPEWCREHIEEIAAWVKEEAKARSIMGRFVPMGGIKAVVLEAIKRSEKEANG